MMNLLFKEYLFFKNELISLEILNKKDFPALSAQAINPEIWRLMSVSFETNEALYDYFYTFLEDYKTKTKVPFCIKDVKSGKPIGMTCFGNISYEKKELELGWTWIGTDFQKTSVNRMTKLILIGFIFNKLQFEKVIFRVNAKNHISMNSLEKIGAIKQGYNEIFNSVAKHKVGVLTYAVNKADWISRLGYELKQKLHFYNDGRI